MEGGECKGPAISDDMESGNTRTCVNCVVGLCCLLDEHPEVEEVVDLGLPVLEADGVLTHQQSSKS